MRVRNRVCIESDRGNRATRGKPVEQRGEEHTKNSNHMRQTPTVHSGIRTRVLRDDKQESNLVPTPCPQHYRKSYPKCVEELRSHIGFSDFYRLILRLFIIFIS